MKKNDLFHRKYSWKKKSEYALIEYYTGLNHDVLRCSMFQNKLYPNHDMLEALKKVITLMQNLTIITNNNFNFTSYYPDKSYILKTKILKFYTIFEDYAKKILNLNRTFLKF